MNTRPRQRGLLIRIGSVEIIMAPNWAKWMEALRTQASSAHPRARITGVLDYYSPFLDDEIGEVVGCWRLPGERDRDYAHRLGIHISEKQNELEALMQRLLKYRH